MNYITETRNDAAPKSLEDCMATDPLVDNLWLWARRLESWGKILFWIIIVFGVIGSIKDAVLLDEIPEQLREAGNHGEPWDVFLTGVINTALVAFLEYCAYHALSLFIGGYASIVQHTKVTAKLAQYNAMQQGDVVVTEGQGSNPASEWVWYCHKCGKENLAYHTACWSCKAVRKSSQLFKK